MNTNVSRGRIVTKKKSVPFEHGYINLSLAWNAQLMARQLIHARSEPERTSCTNKAGSKMLGMTTRFFIFFTLIYGTFFVPFSLQQHNLLFEMDQSGALVLPLHPRKKARIRRNDSSPTSSPAYPKPNQLMHSLPPDILENILRFLSSLQNARNWDNHIPFNDTLLLYRLCGGLLETFHMLCISKTVGYTHELQLYKWKGPKQGVLWTDSMDKALDFILTGGGESLRTLIIGDEMYDELISGKTIVDVFHRACPNVRSLSVVENFGVWSSAFAVQLEKLEIASYDPAGAIPKCCPSLLELSIPDYGNGFPNTDLIDVDWESVGSKLESLTISGGLLCDEGLARIRENCNKIKRISIHSVPRANGSIVEFIASYGDQLDFVYIKGMFANDLTRIVGTCTMRDLPSRFLKIIYYSLL